MTVEETNIPGLKIITPKVFEDARGYFYESYNEKKLLENGIDITFRQDNQSKSGYGVIRGLHFQNPPHAQTKLVRVLEGAIYDVAVDIRKDSSTFGQWLGIELTADNKKQLLIPHGFAHGFSVLSDTAVVLYKCDNLYEPSSEGGIIFNDPNLNINWQILADKQKVSDKDVNLPGFHDMNNDF